MSNTMVKKEKISNNTHDYDTKLKELYKNFLIVDKEELINPLSFEDTINEIKDFIKTIKHNNRLKKNTNKTI